MMLYTADFETTTDPADCRVWATGICTIDDNNKFFMGTALNTFSILHDCIPIQLSTSITLSLMESSFFVGCSSMGLHM